VNTMAKQNLLTDVQIDQDGLSIGKIENSVPPETKSFVERVYRMIPRVKITDVLTDVEDWTGFTKHFIHANSERPAENKRLLLTGILADGLNLGPTKMAEACPGTSYESLSSVYSWHVRDETYNAALAELTNAQMKQPIARLWGDGTRSSSDGQRFPTGSHAYDAGWHNPKYGSGPGMTIYSYISDQYGRFYSKVITSGLRDATHVLDGLLYHESGIRIKEHYTDTAGYTEHVFALMHLLGFKYAPRIRGLGEMKLYVPPGSPKFDPLDILIGDKLDLRLIRSHWDEILRLASSIRQGTVTASVMVRKLSSYSRQNGLKLAVRELGRLERTLFILEWFRNPELRRRVGAELNKSESTNSLCRAVFLHRAGEVRDRTIQAQKHRASGLNLVVSAIILWNSVYVNRVIESMRSQGVAIDPSLLSHVSPIGWEHINLTGDYVWRTIETKSADGFRHFHRPSFA
jgi:TnpA family transposase